MDSTASSSGTHENDSPDVEPSTSSGKHGETSTSRITASIPESKDSRKKQSKIGQFLRDARPCSASRSELLDKKITKMLVQDLLPLSLVEGGGFRELMATVEPNYSVPSRQTATRRIEVLYGIVKNDLLNELKEVDHIGLTTDSWTSRATESYVTVTAHFLTKDYVVKNNVLVTVNTEERHTADNLADFLTNVACEWEIEKKISAIVHDNASNIEAALRRLPFESISCFAHTLQLSIKKGLAIKEVDSALADASRIVTHFKHSVVALDELRKRQELFQLPKQTLIQQVKTRWNSAYDMVSRLIEQRRAVVDVLTDRSVTPFNSYQQLKISEESWELLKQLEKCLKPLKSATDVLSSQKNVTLSSVLPIAHSIVTHHLKSNSEDSDVIRSVKKNIAMDLEVRIKLNSPSELSKSALTLASLLDPRYKSLLFLPEEFRGVAQKTLEDLLEVEFSNMDTHDTEADSVPEEGGTCAIDFLLGPEYRNPSTLKQNEELSFYLKDPPIRPSEDPLIWWKRNDHRFPVLAKIARQYLVIPGTSVPAERVFSTAGLIISSIRSRLTPDHANMLIFLNKNM